MRELKAIARNPSNPNARLADDALDHGRAVSTRFYNSNAPSLAKHGARGAFTASPMTAGGGWAVAGFLIDAAAAASREGRIVFTFLAFPGDRLPSTFSTWAWVLGHALRDFRQRTPSPPLARIRALRGEGRAVHFRR